MANKNNNLNYKDINYVKLAFEQASINLGSTSGNPSVGCVVVKNNSVISSGHTSLNGRPHAEDNALKKKIDYKNSDIYIQASGYEGLPHTLLEAISYNLSIISTPIGGTNEILENDTNGWTIQLIDGKYPSEKEIANKVKYILNNKQEDKIKKIRARKLLIENFDKNINFEKYVDTIESFNKNAK